MRIYTNLDAAESIFLDRQLMQIKARAYEQRYPDLMARSLVPTSPEPAPDGVKTLVYVVEDLFGDVKIMGDKADDLPLVGEKATEFSQKVRDLGVAFKYDLGEVRAAARLGRDLPGGRAEKARKLAERKLDEILAIGNTKAGLNGLLSHASVPAATITTRNTHVTFATKTADEILADFAEVCQTIVNTTKGIFGDGLTVLLPDSQWTYISTTPRSSTTDTTILNYILGNMSQIKEVKRWFRCAAAGAGGTDRMVVYPRTNEVLYSEIPSEFEVLDPQPKGFSFYVPTRLTTAGVIIPQPKAMLYRDGI